MSALSQCLNAIEALRRDQDQAAFHLAIAHRAKRIAQLATEIASMTGTMERRGLLHEFETRTEDDLSGAATVLQAAMARMEAARTLKLAVTDLRTVIIAE